jgi:hypothetical protein
MNVKTSQRTQRTGTDSSGSYPDARQLSDSELFHLLHTSRRRKTIQYLLERGEPVYLSTLARNVAALEHETPTEKVTPEQYQRVYIPLYQAHLPKLDEAGVIKYDQSRGLIEPTEQLKIFHPYLSWVDEQNIDVRPSPNSTGSGKRDVSDWYLAAACLSMFLLVVTIVGWIPLSGELLGGVIIALFLAANAAATR